MSAIEPVKIFVSYKKDGVRKGDRQGRDFIEELIPAIEAEADEVGTTLEIWYDKALRTGTEWETGIETALNDAEVFVLVYATGFFDANGFIAAKELPAVLRHLRGARRSNNLGTVIPLVRDGVELPAGIPDEFSELRTLQAANEGRPIDVVDEASRADALREVARSIVTAATAVYSRRKATSLRPPVNRLVADLMRVRTELERDVRTNPEDQLKFPVKTFLESAGPALGRQLVSVFTEHRAVEGDDVQGVRLDMSVKRSSGELIGHVELKAPAKSANPKKPVGWSNHDRQQWKKLQDHPNLIYCNGFEWTLWRHGTDYPVAHVELERDATGEIPDRQIRQLAVMLGDFLAWTPIVPSAPRALARRLAPLAGLLRDAVIDHVTATKDKDCTDSRRGLSAMYSNWSDELMPGASIKEFADSFAQTFTYALLLARIEAGGIEPLRTERVSSILNANGHKLLGSVLQLMNQEVNREPVEAALSLLESTIGAVDPDRLTAKRDPWLYFYEDFLAEYDVKMRNDAGVYYTPVEVVKAQVRLVDDLLKTRFGLRGLGDNSVKILDPALGTGTYLLSAAEKVLAESSAPRDDARSLARRLNGFELLVGPYSVAHLRLTQMLEKSGADLGVDGVNIFLTNTLTDPGDVSDTGQQVSMWEVMQNVTEDNRRAGVVKKDRTDIRVILGNPPYDRGSRSKSLGAGSLKHRNIVLQGDDGKDPLLEDFIEPLRQAGQGGQAKNLYNSYVYFWRWAIWKACEQNPEKPGVVSFITSSSYLRGPGFAGMREYMRRMFDEIWIIDLGGEGRGAFKDENVFNIQTPVCIAICIQRATDSNGVPVRPNERKKSKSDVWYRKLEGSRRIKLDLLAEVGDPYTSPSMWSKVSSEDWGGKFVDSQSGVFFDFTRLADVFPWSHSGVQFKRKWPIAASKDALIQRWNMLYSKGTASPELFKESDDRTVSGVYSDVKTGRQLPPLSDSHSRDSMVMPEGYGYRSFNRQWALPDSRLASRIRPQLWNTRSPKQIYLASLSSTRLGRGPAITVSSLVPDLDFFSNRGAKDIMPLYRDSSAASPNLSSALLKSLTQTYGQTISAEDVASYVFGLLGTGAFTSKFTEELRESAALIPFTKDLALFREVAEFGRDLIWHQTYGDRFGALNQFGQPEPLGLTGSSRLKSPTSAASNRYPEGFLYVESTNELTVGDGVFSSVPKEVMDFEVSGMKVVHSWLGYRMKSPAGRTSSPLDRIQADQWEFDSELLELLWLLEYMVEAEPKGTNLLDRVISGITFTSKELGGPTDAEKAAPSAAELALPEELLPVG